MWRGDAQFMRIVRHGPVVLIVVLKQVAKGFHQSFLTPLRSCDGRLSQSAFARQIPDQVEDNKVDLSR